MEEEEDYDDEFTCYFLFLAAYKVTNVSVHRYFSTGLTF
jgi:hypothetical protein